MSAQAEGLASGSVFTHYDYCPEMVVVPAVNIDWPEAKAYADWLAVKTGKLYRLISESEFEYAAREGSKTAWFRGGNDAKTKT